MKDAAQAGPGSAARPAPPRAPRIPRVLVVDDEADLRELLELTLVGMGLDVDCAATLAEARALLERAAYALCLTDMRLPDGNGMDLVAQIARQRPDMPVAVITAYGSAENAVAALKAGAFDYLSKPVALDSLRALVRSALQVSAAGMLQGGADGTGGVGGAGGASGAGGAGGASGAGDAGSAGSAGSAGGAGAAGAAASRGQPPGGARILGVSAAVQEVRDTIARLARSMAPVAITGESGTGKELAARLVHESGARAAKPFVAVNCGAIPEALMEAEFFGYRKGAFTGADAERDGFFQAADGGTLFLDEVADLPLAMQVKLLRAIQEKRVRKVGATTEEPVDVRIVSATHQDLSECVAAGRFRQDLYYRLNVIELKLPPLRERRDDIPVLADAILARLAARAGLRQAPRLASVTLKYLQSYAFPGNVRELENILERALAFANGDTINVEDLGLRPAVSDAAANERAEPDGMPRAGALHPAGSTYAAGPAHAAGPAYLASPAHAAGPRQAADPLSAAASPVSPGAVVPSDPIPHASAAGRGLRVSEDGIPESLPDYLDEVERDAIQRALERTRYNRTAAARLLGISFRALRYRMQRLDIH